METKFSKEALFGGMTANAFKLGTVLSLGWFWTRVAGVCILYRGVSMEAVEFSDILSVAETDAEQIAPPEYITHPSNSTHFYVVRKTNNCGEQEHTLTAAVKIVLDTDGDLASPAPNNIFEARADQKANSKVKLLWYYCPLEQKSVPVCFKVYYDASTGLIDYENPIAVIDYIGRKFYSYESNTLEAGRYLFAIRTEDSVGTENRSLTQLRLQVDSAAPDQIEILSVKVV